MIPQLGEPNLTIRVYSEVESKWLTLTFIAVTSPVESGEVNVGPSPRDDTVSTSVRAPPESTTKD